MTNSNINIGGANVDVIKRAANKAVNTLSVANAGTVQAFLDRWLQFFESHAKHLRMQNQILGAPVTIVHVNNCKEMGENLNWGQRPMLGTTPTDVMAGVLAIATDIGGYVHPTKLNYTENVQIEITNSKLVQFPTVMLASLDKIFIWPDGISNLGNSIEVELKDNPVVDDKLIDNLLENFYKYRAIYGTNWWKDASKFITKEKPESLVQNSLWDYLLQLATVARVSVETPIDSGRADITVRPRNPTLKCKSCVLELKTIRCFKTPRINGTTPTKISKIDNIKWACAGVQQAASYRDSESLDVAFLCIYDFRSTDDVEIDTHLAKDALLHNVIHRRYWITSNHKAYRDKNYPISS